MGLTTTNRQVIDDVPYGIYVWRLPSGEHLGDGDGNTMLIQSTRGDQDKINKLTAAAKSYGFEEGEAVYLSGHRPITDEEYEEQLSRAAEGLTPDPFDIGAIRDEMQALRQHNGR